MVQAPYLMSEDILVCWFCHLQAMGSWKNMLSLFECQLLHHKNGTNNYLSGMCNEQMWKTFVNCINGAIEMCDEMIPVVFSDNIEDTLFKHKRQ